MLRIHPLPDTYKVKISDNDGTVKFLDDKLAAGAGVTLTEQSDGGDETLQIAASGTGTIAIEEGDVSIGDADTLDFSSADFVISVAAGEAEIAIEDSGIDHGSIGGLADDDHSQYLNTARHDTTARHGSSVVDHGSIGGLTDDDHALYALIAGGRTLSGVWDFGGVTSLEIPNAADPTIDATGEIAVDTTLDVIKFHDGGGERVLNPVQSKGFMIETPVAADDMAVWRTDVAITLTKVTYLCVGGTNWVGQLQECDANGLNGADVHTSDVTAVAGTTESQDAF